MKTKISKKSTGQYRLTIKQGIGTSLDLDGAIVKQIIKSRNKIQLQILDENDMDTVEEDGVSKINKDSNGQFKMTILKGIGSGLELDGAKVNQIVKSSSTIDLNVVER